MLCRSTQQMNFARSDIEDVALIIHRLDKRTGGSVFAVEFLERLSEVSDGVGGGFFADCG